ncbi:MAG: DUF2807 domain-containing protein [Bacteroidales bacterium]|nr:DUF2807 domain-containing protein [Bacteroidales bacterium]
MKTNLSILFFALMILPFLGSAQTEDKTVRELESFNRLIIGGYYKVNLYVGEPKIEIYAKESLAEKIITKVQNEVLQISNKPISRRSPIQIDIYAPSIIDYDITGAVLLQTKAIQSPERLAIELGGAANVVLDIETSDVYVAISGASILELRGKAKNLDVRAKGAAIIKTAQLEVANTDVVLSGSAGLIKHQNNQNSFFEERGDTNNVLNTPDKEGEKTTYGVTYSGSTARAKFLGIQVDVDEDDESGEVKIGTHKWEYDSDGWVSHKRIRQEKFNGHWGGFGLGINGYVNDKFVYELPEEYEFMNLLWQKSVNVDINLFEQNIQLSKNGNIGLVTGIGYSIYNYRFTKSFTVMTADSSYFSALYNKGINVRKSKIVTNYITVPVIFEIQDRNPSPLTKHRWHANIGVIFGIKVHTHQKTYFNELNKDYDLVNPITGNIDATATSPSYAKVKVHDDFYMNPFKLDASLRVGWGWVNLYANMSLIEMFSVGKGPKLYPFSVGIMLVSW